MQNVQALAEALEVNYFAFPQKAQGVNYGRVIREHHQVFICCSCLLLCCCIKKATFFALFRKVLLLIPLILILPRIGFGITGVFAAEPVADTISATTCFVTFLLTAYRKLGRMEQV